MQRRFGNTIKDISYDLISFDCSFRSFEPWKIHTKTTQGVKGKEMVPHTNAQWIKQRGRCKMNI